MRSSSDTNIGPTFLPLGFECLRETARHRTNVFFRGSYFTVLSLAL